MKFRERLFAIFALGVAAAGGCGSVGGTGSAPTDAGGDLIDIPGLGDPAGNPDRTPGDPNPSSHPELLRDVTVRFANTSGASAVQVEFYVGTVGVQNPATDLFRGENLRTANIGIGGTGWIPPRSFDSVELACHADLAIGTLGGAFAHNDSGDATGRGTPRWLSQQSTGFCGQTVTFVFVENGGLAATRVLIEGTDDIGGTTP